MTELEKRTLLTVITESVLENRLMRDLTEHGVRGFTISDARGKGSRGVRDASWQEAANIRIEVLCPHSQAEALLAHLQATYYRDYAMIGFMHDVEVLRPEKF